MFTMRPIVHRRILLRLFHKCRPLYQIEAAAMPVENLTIPVVEGGEVAITPKIEKLVQDITALNLIEVAQLSNVLKKRLNLPDAPMMAMGNMVAAKSEEEENVAPQRVQTSFTVKLMKFDDKQKVPLIKEIKTLLSGMNLVQAKKFVESAPTVVKSDVSKEEAEQLKAAITKVGGEIEIS